MGSGLRASSLKARLYLDLWEVWIDKINGKLAAAICAERCELQSELLKRGYIGDNIGVL